MIESKHTPGPEQIIAYLRSNEDDIADSFECSISDLEQVFRELAAAPDLYKACKTVMHSYKEPLRGTKTSCVGYTIQTSKEAFKLLQAALDRVEKGN